MGDGGARGGAEVEHLVAGLHVDRVDAASACDRDGLGESIELIDALGIEIARDHDGSLECVVHLGKPQQLAKEQAVLVAARQGLLALLGVAREVRCRHQHTLLSARDYTASALDDKDWPVLRTPDVDTGVSLFAPRVLEGVSSLCDAS